MRQGRSIAAMQPLLTVAWQILSAELSRQASCRSLPPAPFSQESNPHIRAAQHLMSALWARVQAPMLSTRASTT